MAGDTKRPTAWLCFMCIFLALGGSAFVWWNSEHFYHVMSFQKITNILPAHMKAYATSNVSVNITSFLDALNECVDESNSVTLSLVDSSYIDMAINLHLSFQQVALKNSLFVSSDANVCKALRNIETKIKCYQFTSDPDSDKASRYGSAAFSRKSHIKTKIVYDAMILGFTVLLVDLDIVFFKNPYKYLTCSDCDLQIQFDHEDINTGFYLVRPTSPSLKLFDKSIPKSIKEAEKITEQHVMDKIIKSMKKEGTLKVKILSEKLFPNGFAYFHDRKIMFASDGPYPPNVVLVHDNWIISEAAKIYRFKENLMWFYDKDAYFSSTTRKYLMYDNCIRAKQRKDVMDLELNALKIAFSIGYLLNRTVILPTFSCKGCTYWGACFNKHGRCSLNTHYKMTTLDEHLGGLYREHMFMQNKLVPKGVLESRTKLFFIENKFTANNKKIFGTIDELGDKVIKLKSNQSEGANIDEIVRWFSPYKDISILQFHSLYKAMNQFPTPFLKTITSAFKKSNYVN